MADKPYRTYVDQNYTEIYDTYDLRSGNPVPQMILDAEDSGDELHGKDVVHIDYPVIDHTWSLNGSVGRASWYEEVGKKAFIHGGEYVHPEKDYTVRIVMMEPEEYINKCVENFNRFGAEVTFDHIVEDRMRDYNLDEVFGPSVGHIFYPVLEINGGQEGLHRAIWAMREGYEEIPVIVIAQ